MSARARLLRDDPPFRALWASRTVSFTGDGITFTVLVLLAAERGGPSAVGLVLLAVALPRLGGPAAGVLADRLDTRRLMASCELGQAVLVGVLAATLPPLPALFALVLAAQVLSSIRAPAGRGVVPRLVGPGDRGRANALLAIAFPLQATAGPALGGLLAAGPGGIRTALAVDAGTFVLSAAFLLRLPPLPGQAVPPPVGATPADPSAAPGPAAAAAPVAGPVAAGRGGVVRGVLGDILEGARYVGAHRRVRALALALTAVAAFGSLDNVALLFLIRGDLGGGPLGYGLTLTALGTGAAVATLALGRTTWRGSAAVVGGTALQAAGTLATGLAPTIVVAGAAQAVGGAGFVAANVGVDTLVQELVPAPLLGRVFGTVGAASQLGSAAAYAAGGPLLAATSARTVFAIAAAGLLAALLPLRYATRDGHLPSPAM